MRRALSHIIVCYWFLVVSVVAQVSVTTWHNDIGLFHISVPVALLGRTLQRKES